MSTVHEARTIHTPDRRSLGLGLFVFLALPVLTSGTLQAAPEACCMPNATCADLEPSTCTSQGGVPGGPGSVCTPPASYEACWLGGLSCGMGDPDCCDSIG